MSQAAIQIRQKEPSVLIDRVSFNSVGELDQLRELAHGASLEIFQLEKGTMHGALAHVEFGNSSLHSNTFSISARGRGCVSNQRWTFVVFPNGVVGKFNLQQLDANSVFVYRPGAEFDGTILGSFQDWVFTVDDWPLRNVVRTLSGTDFQMTPATFSAIAPDPKLVADLRLFALNILTMARETPELFACESFRKSVQDNMLEQLARLLISQNKLILQRSGAAVSHSRLVRMSEDFLAAHLERPVSIAELCTVNDSSERTVRNAFQSVLGISPQAYLKLRRMRSARIQLERSNIEDSTVATIAISKGFNHLGHFSRDYRRLYGENPSRTLAKRYTLQQSVIALKE